MGRFRASALLRSVLLPSLVIWLAGCYKWVPVEAPGPALQEASENESPGRVRIHLATGAMIEGRPVGMFGDSLVLQTEDGPAVQVNVSVGSIERAEFRREDVFGIILFTVGIIAVPLIIYGTALVISCSGKSSSEGESCPA